jgi:uncharacterized membrane protein YgcG
MTRLLAALWLVLWLPVLAQPLRADERILSYHADIEIAPDATMTVTETIAVRAEGHAIRRGIYRDFPTRYRDRLGNAYQVGFEVLGVTRNDQPEPWRQERRSNGQRVYAGSADTYIERGVHHYRLRYRTNRQLGFFEGHDELYWNVTGNGWQFPIDRASARVTLPAAVSTDALAMTGYTGHQGATGQNYSARVWGGGGQIESTRPLAAGEGLTLVLTFPSGIVQPPATTQRLAYLLQDNWGLAMALLALLGSAVILHLAWRRHGRDPAAGVIFPHYEPPAGYSPASARYITRMAYDNKTFAAAVINLAVKGHLSITRTGGDYLLRRRTSAEPLAPGESALLAKLFRQGVVIELHNKNHRLMRAARSAHLSALRRDYLNTYFRANSARLAPTFLASLAVLAVVLVTGNMVPLAWLVFALNLVMHVIYLVLMKAPLPRGRALMNRLEGFRLYLDVAEKEDLARSAPPKMTPQLFEAYLPFALALGVEQAWSERFAREFAFAEGDSYKPAWYHGDFDSHRMGAFASDVGSKLSSAISSSSSAPGSSSGSSGSSGGGGGGGGGGGW